MSAVVRLTCPFSTTSWWEPSISHFTSHPHTNTSPFKSGNERQACRSHLRSVVVRAEEGAAASTGPIAKHEPLLIADVVNVEPPKLEVAAMPKPKLSSAVTEKAIATKMASKKPAEKSLGSLMSEDVIPELREVLEKEGISDLILVFEDDQLQGCFRKNGIPYSFWAYFPDGKLEGSKGFSFSSHGAPPSTVEPFLIDEKKITAKLIVFWVWKRLMAQHVFTEVNGS